MTRSFGLTFDYRCPFARNGHEAAVNALREGADLDIRFLAVLARPGPRRGGRAAGVGARSRRLGHRHPGADVRHRGPRRASPTTSSTPTSRCSRQRHDHGLKLGHEDVLQEAIEKVGLDAAAVKDEVVERASARRPRRGAHPPRSTSTRCSACPRSSTDDDAVFVRYMERGRADDLAPDRRPARVEPPERVQAHPPCHADPADDEEPSRADVAQRGRHVGGREGPRAPLRLLQRHGARRAAVARTGSGRRSSARSSRSRVSSTGSSSPPLRIAAPEWRADPTLRRRLPHPPDRDPRAGVDARLPRRRRRSPPRRRSTGRGRCGSSRSSRGSTAVGPRSSNGSTTRSPTASAACGSRSASSTSSASRRPRSRTPCARSRATWPTTGATTTPTIRSTATRPST